MRPTFADAINSLCSKPTSFWSEGDRILGWDVSEEKSGEPQPTEDAISAELTRLQTEYDSGEYSRNRRAAYEAESDHLFFEEQAGEIADGTHAAKRLEIKERFPK